jgi:hypothetical protein
MAFFGFDAVPMLSGPEADFVASHSGGPTLDL